MQGGSCRPGGRRAVEVIGCFGVQPGDASPAGGLALGPGNQEPNRAKGFQCEA